MTSFVIKQAPLQAAVALIKSQCAAEIDMTMSEDGMGIYAMDPSGSSMVLIKLLKGAFEGDITEPTDFSVPLDFIEKCCKMGTALTVSVDKGLMTVSSGRAKRSIKLLARDMPQSRSPKVELTKSCEIQSDDLRVFFAETDLKTLCDRYGLKVTFSHTELHVSVNTDTESFSDGLLTLGPEEEVSCRFNSLLLVPLMKALPKGMTVKLCTEGNYPLKLTMADDTIDVTAFLAPMIVSEDDLDG